MAGSKQATRTSAPGRIVPVRYIKVGASPLAPSRARYRTEEALEQWGWNPHTDPAKNLLMLVSELVTNAVEAPGTTKWVVLRAWPVKTTLVHLEVGDRSPQHPLLHPVSLAPAGDDLDAILAQMLDSGRGLFLIEQLSSGWGYYDRHGGGNFVWFEFSLPRARTAA